MTRCCRCGEPLAAGTACAGCTAASGGGATILLVEDAPDLALDEAPALESAGHRVVRCGGSRMPYSACPLLRFGECSIAAPADLIIFSVPLGGVRFRGWAYSGTDLLRAYRAHPRFGRLPMLIVSVGDPGPLEGIGPVEIVDRHSMPGVVARAVERLLGADVPRRVRA